ncbi:ribonuclease P protein component [Mycoplasmoides pirum]|uniref:ribonuclease P protein component n=1 Tax=Mycoplasmoides pirum TaxID=2122 RepID=UPI000696609E|nr:ribonuclease P protein component [Mycoplasmoides pirum]
MQKKYRLSDKKVFESITKQKKIHSKNFLIYFQKNKKNFFRISINPPKSKFKLAVSRNKIKRQIRTFFDKIPNKQISLDLLIIVKTTYLENTYKNNCYEFLKIIDKIKDLNNL